MPSAGAARLFWLSARIQRVLFDKEVDTQALCTTESEPESPSKLTSGMITAAATLTGNDAALAEHKIRDATNAVHECLGDEKRLRPDQSIGGEGRRACMKESITQLSSPCFVALMKVVTAPMTPPPDYPGTAKSIRLVNLRSVQYCELTFSMPNCRKGSPTLGCGPRAARTTRSPSSRMIDQVGKQ